MKHTLNLVTTGLVIGCFYLIWLQQQQINQLSLPTASTTPAPATPIQHGNSVSLASFAVVAISNDTDQRSGSGVILDDEGLIITNAHVLSTGKHTVRLNDGRVLGATVLAQSQSTDLALLHVNAMALTPLKISLSRPQIGDTVYALGHPLDVGMTATRGIVSGIKGFSLFNQENHEYIQTDAIIHPGSSGGALINEQGELLGINTLFLADKQYLGISFVLPMYELANIIKELMLASELPQGYLGINLTRVMNSQFKDRLLITSLTPGGRAQQLGFRIGDVLPSNITSRKELIETINAKEKIQVFRHGQELQI